MNILMFVGFWIVVSVMGAVGLGKWLKHQRVKYGGNEAWHEEWSK